MNDKKLMTGSLFWILVVTMVSAQFVNDDCVDSRTNTPGICLLASDCPAVQQEFQRSGRKPTLCSYQGNDLVVCCSTSGHRSQKPTNTQQQPDGQPPTFSSWTQPDEPTWPSQPATQPDEPAWPSKSSATQPNTNVVFGDSSGMRKSQQKCDEYSKLAIHTGSFTLLSVMTAVDQVNIPSCTYPTGLIVGGIVTKAGEFPHMAVIGWTEASTVQWNCGGSLISDRYVMTAGHCGSARGVRPDIVRLGEQNLVRTDDRANPQDYGVDDVIMHPDYKQSSHYNDISLIRLSSKVKFNKFIRPACLWQNHEVNSTRGVATGWGKVEFGGDKSDELMKVTLDFVNNEQCSAMYEPAKRIRSGIVDTQMCAGILAGGRDTCQGDSGGPIQVLTPDNQCIFHIVGITSFGRACAARNSVGVYTRVYSYLGWIESVVWP